tara:strand:- start:912 stop:1400 length:489 start_codon:yes stop_codon:yes gene_type:complete
MTQGTHTGPGHIGAVVDPNFENPNFDPERWTEDQAPIRLEFIDRYQAEVSRTTEVHTIYPVLRTLEQSTQNFKGRISDTRLGFIPGDAWNRLLDRQALEHVRLRESGQDEATAYEQAVQPLRRILQLAKGNYAADLPASRAILAETPYGERLQKVLQEQVGR